MPKNANKFTRRCCMYEEFTLLFKSESGRPYPYKMEFAEVLSVVTNLQAIIITKNKQIKCLENRIENLEHYTKKENIIISGLTTNCESYARQCEPNNSNMNYASASDVELQSLENKVVGYLSNRLECNMKSSDISACHTHTNDLRGKPDNTIIKFIGRRTKNDVKKKPR